MRARNSSRLLFQTSWTGSSLVKSPAPGASADSTGFLNRRVSSSTRQSNPIRRAMSYRKSRSETLAWSTCSTVLPESSTSAVSPASLAICDAMSEYLTFRNVVDLRPAARRCDLS